MGGTKNSKKAEDTYFVRAIQRFFEWTGDAVCYAPWTCIIVSTLLTIVCSLKIPFTEMVNNISDFTPYGARSRQELKIYESFFSDRGEPKVVYAFITPKNGTNLLTKDRMDDTIRVLDKIDNDLVLRTPDGNKTFQQFCKGFCSFNEPVRAFAKGLFLYDGVNDGSSHIDLGYPVTTVLGRKIYMDPNFFGVQIRTTNSEGVEQILEAGDIKDILNQDKQIPNNIHGISLIVLHFRAEIGKEISSDDLKKYEKDVLMYFQDDFHSDVINVNILTDNFITSEIVRAGLSLLPFLLIGFTIMAIFSTATFAASSYMLQQWNIYKIVLAFMACTTPFMACGTSMGLMFLCGWRFGSILCVTPFLVLAIGVDDAYLMVNAWQRISTQRRKVGYNQDDLRAELVHRVREMLVETGPSVSITTITNALAFGIGALTPTPEIQLFSIGNALAVVIDFIYQLSIYAAIMVVIGEKEIEEEVKRRETERVTETKEKTLCVEIQKEEKKNKGTMRRLLTAYCNTLCNKWISGMVLLILGVYWYLSILGTMSIRPELDPYKLFLHDSDIREIFTARKVYISPNYASCWILVNNPGDIRNSTDHDRLHQLVKDFESLPPALGPYSTKFFLRDFDDFTSQGSDGGTDYDVEDEEEEEEMEKSNTTSSLTTSSTKRNDLSKFLTWPEFSFWKGFVQTKNTSDGLSVQKFFFTTAFHGHEYVEWSQRAVLLNMWRGVADKYPTLNITVYEDDAKFLDLIETMVDTTSQSALFTFLSMFVVAMLFISDPPTLFVATFSILSTSIGVFGIVAWWGADLDPILMSATVMSIGFAVDIPAHIGYHYFQTGKEHSTVIERLEETVASVGFPIMQASISTTLCVLSLFCVDLHMSHIFAKTMFLVVVIGMIHGMVVIPVLFNLISFVPSRKNSRLTISGRSPVVYTVNR